MRHLLSFKLNGIKHWADSLLIVPPLVGEGLSVAEAAQKSAKLVEPLRRKMVYPNFRRWMALALVLTTWQMMLVMLGMTLDGRRRELYDSVVFRLPILLALCVTAFNLGLKSSLEQAILYLTARSASGEITADASGLSSTHEKDHKTRGWWLSFKTYGLTGALFLLVGSLQFLKFPLMHMAMYSPYIYTVKTLQTTGVPLPFTSTADRTPGGLQRWLRKVDFPFRDYSYKPYGPRIIHSWPMTEFLLQKGVDVNVKISLDGSWSPPGIGAVVMTPLQLALTMNHVDRARSLLEHGADVHVRDSIGRTPLIIAITYCPQAINSLVASGADLNEETRFGPTLLAAARYQWLYRNMRQPQEDKNAVQILLKNGVNPNTRDRDGRNALMVMSMEHRTDGDNYGIGFGPELKLSGLKHSLLIDKKASLQVDRMSMDLEFIPDEALQLIGETLLRAGCDINAADSNGRTPLMYAVRYNRPTAVRLLFLNGADITAQDKQGMTVFEMAKKTENQRIINWFQHAQSDAKR
jgi:ankyrin repeat protein